MILIPLYPPKETAMTQTFALATVGLLTVLVVGAASAQTVPAADPHAGHVMPVNPHAGHDMSGMTGMTVPAPTGTSLKASSPAAGAMLMGSPGAISLTLPHAMTMDAIVLTNAAGQRIPLSATLSDVPIETLTTPVPALAAGTYTVAWTASAGANHTMTGTFSFMVH